MQKFTPLMILGIVGSLRRDSYNRALLRAAKELAPDGVEVEIYEGLELVPHYNADDEGADMPPAAVDLKQRVAQADAVLIVTPEYNGGVPGALKDAIDWASRPYGSGPLTDKPVAILGASPGRFGTARAQPALRQILQVAGATVVDTPAVLVANAPDRFDHDGRLTDPSIRQLVRELVERLAADTGSALPAAA